MTIKRVQGCLLGQLAGDALGSLVEIQSPEEIRLNYPNGLRELADGGTWNTIAGQPTDDSEMVLMLARMLIERGTNDSDAALTHPNPMCLQTNALLEMAIAQTIKTGAEH